MEGISAALTLKALDGLSARAVATAENIANANTPYYRPLRVSFEQALLQAAGRGTGAVAGVAPSATRAAGPDGELRLDLELATASSTAGRYAALIELLGRQMQMHSLAATGGR